MKGHIGVYIGDGLAVECSPAWKNSVQITACNCTKAGYNRRNWTKHGELSYIEYVKETMPQPAKSKTDSFFPAHGYLKKAIRTRTSEKSQALCGKHSCHIQAKKLSAITTVITSLNQLKSFSAELA